MRWALSPCRANILARASPLTLGAYPYPPISSVAYSRPWATQLCSLYAQPLPRRLHAQSHEAPSVAGKSHEKAILKRLPLQCTGCGAFTQTVDPASAGYFNLGRKAVREYLGLVQTKSPKKEVPDEDRVVVEALNNFPPEQLEALGLSRDSLIPDSEKMKPQKISM